MDEVNEVNEVTLVGRLSAPVERRTLPSGDEIAALTVVVQRTDGGTDALPVQFGPAPAPGRRRTTQPVGRRDLAKVVGLNEGHHVRVSGRLRRRWWEAGGARRSRVEVDAAEVTDVGDGNDRRSTSRDSRSTVP